MPKQKIIWQKHKFLVIVKAYKKYLELIEEQNVFDFNRLQDETKKFLMEHRDEVPFTNILIDEFELSTSNEESINVDGKNIIGINCDTTSIITAKKRTPKDNTFHLKQAGQTNHG